MSVFCGTIVAHSCAPAFYTGDGVPDTINGRFDMIVLHAALLLRQGAGRLALRARSQRATCAA